MEIGGKNGSGYYFCHARFLLNPSCYVQKLVRNFIWSNSTLFHYGVFTGRYQDENTQAFFMVVSCNRWLAVRLDLLSSVFVTVVAVGAILVTENPGELVKALSLSNASFP